MVYLIPRSHDFRLNATIWRQAVRAEDGDSIYGGEVIGAAESQWVTDRVRLGQTGFTRRGRSDGQNVFRQPGAANGAYTIASAVEFEVPVVAGRKQ